MTPPTTYQQCMVGMDSDMSNYNDSDRFPVRKNPRQKSIDYTSYNYYFVTICTKDKVCLFGSPAKPSGNGAQLSAIIGLYKSAVTKDIRITQPEITVWQTFFHDHMIRNQADYERIWSYIETNPARWMDDCFYIPQPDL